METETLSDKIQFIEVTNGDNYYIQKKDVKEFIWKLKDLGDKEQLPEWILNKIDRLAGEDLI